MRVAGLLCDADSAWATRATFASIVEARPPDAQDLKKAHVDLVPDAGIIRSSRASRSSPCIRSRCSLGIVVVGVVPAVVVVVTVEVFVV